MLWTNELSARYGLMCVISLYTGEGIFTYYKPSQHIKHTCMFQYKDRSPPLPAVLVLVLGVKLLN